MKTIQVNASSSYQVNIGRDILRLCGELTAELRKPCGVVLVSDDNVYPIYGEAVKASYEKSGFKVDSFVIPSGERSKNMDTVVGLLEFMAGKQLTRGDIVVALGGGVIGDLAGFAAAVYLRGIPYVQIPTTFLAAIDSSVGGKTGVDLKSGKNLAGAFHQPFAVFCDTDTFETLPAEVFADGVCEAVKYGCISDKCLFDLLLEEDLKQNIETVVETCVAIKRTIVENDEFDTGERQLLNFGHTAGHAIEVLSDYEITHGRAVAMGMYIMAEPDIKPLISNMFEKYKVDIKCGYTAKQLAEKALSDKKRSGGDITVVLLEKIGAGYLKKIKVAELEEFFEKQR